MKFNLPIIIVVATAIIAVIIFDSENTTSTLIIVLFSGVIATLVENSQRKQERKEDEENWLLRNKEACYIESINVMIILMLKKHVGIINDKEMKEQMQRRLLNLKSAIVVWGSPELIQQWESIPTIIEKRTPEEMIRQGERFLRTVRKDLGHDDSNLEPGALWAYLVVPHEKQMALDACKGEKYD